MGLFGSTNPKPERDPTLTEILTRIVELEDEWRAFLTQQARYAARMAKRAKDDLERDHHPPAALDHKAELRRRASQLRGNFRGGGTE